ncbi:MAG: class I SAM-dependent rRNA methyltransferase [Desulfuromonadales bacterium]|nr:class I SAM-dependent rRNA methyltransferase [Desulfuromonadales bacterium]
MKDQKPLYLTVGPETARMLKLGHPWVIADRFTARWPACEPGRLAVLADADGSRLGTALLDPQARVVARLLSRESIVPDRPWFVQRLQAAGRARRWLDLGDTSAWRLVNGEGDGLPGISVDRYGDHLLVQYYTPAWAPYLAQLVDALREVFAPRGIYGKFRPQETRRQKGETETRGRLLAGNEMPDGHLVREHGLSYRVDLVRDLHTGLFLDQRTNRLQFRRLAAGNRVLNLFAYTGAFSLAAAAGGALQVTSVDAAGRYLEWARDNFRHNEIDPADHRFITGDCFVELDCLAAAGERFDIVLMDPPSFSTTRKSRFTTTGGTAELVGKALQLLPPGGLLITSSNLQKMTLDDYLKELRRGSLAAGRRLQVTEVAGQGGDFPFPVGFPEGRYLKYVVSVVQD